MKTQNHLSPGMVLPHRLSKLETTSGGKGCSRCRASSASWEQPPTGPLTAAGSPETSVNGRSRAPTSSGVPAAAPHELRRGPLLELLHRQKRRSLIVLVAPAGTGKSFLAAAYARESGALVIWLPLRANDRDSRALFGRLADALEATSGTPHALRAGLAASAEGVCLARLLLKDLALSPAGFILVLDDFHIVQDSDDVVDAVDTLVSELPEMGQLVLAARKPPPLSMTRLVATNAVFGLGADVLRFTEEESREMRESPRDDRHRPTRRSFGCGCG